MNNMELLREGRTALARIHQVIEERGKAKNRKYDYEEAFCNITAMLAEALDDHHHAPMCGANHYHGGRMPAARCTCGAWQHGVLMVNHPALGRTRLR